MSMDAFMNRQRKRGQKKRKARGDTGGSDFRRWPVTLGDGESGEFYPMRDADGEPVLEAQFGHTWNKTRNIYACTEDLPGFHDLCVYCSVYEQELPIDWDDRRFQMRYSQYFFLGVWDPNPWKEETYLNEKKEEKKRHAIWEPRRPGQEPPKGCTIGGKRFFRMGKNAWAEFETYIDQLAAVCHCVGKTNDPEASQIYIVGAECPHCGCELYSEADLDEYDTVAKMMQEVFREPHECNDEANGGCWTTEKKEAEDWFYPKPIRACANHTAGGDCTGPRPLTPFDGPAIVTRTGQRAQTKYGWKRQDKLSWAEWLAIQPPQEALDLFQDGMKFSNRLRIEGLEEQAKMLGIKFPFEKKARSYKLKK